MCARSCQSEDRLAIASQRKERTRKARHRGRAKREEEEEEERDAEPLAELRTMRKIKEQLRKGKKHQEAPNA